MYLNLVVFCVQNEGSRCSNWHIPGEVSCSGSSPEGRLSREVGTTQSSGNTDIVIFLWHTWDSKMLRHLQFNMKLLAIVAVTYCLNKPCFAYVQYDKLTEEQGNKGLFPVSFSLTTKKRKFLFNMFLFKEDV